MGVIRNLSSLGGSIEDDEQNGWNLEQLIEIGPNDVTNQNHINNLQNELNNQAQEEDLLIREQRNRNRRVRDQNKRNGRGNNRPQPTFRALGCRGTSHKKYRRYENANLLAQSIAKTPIGVPDDELLDDVSIYDFVPNTVSAFTQLMKEAENMQAWNEFISRSEEEQDFILKNIDNNTNLSDVYTACDKAKRLKQQKCCKRRTEAKHRSSLSSTGSEESEAGTSKMMGAKQGAKRDKRFSHPSFCAKECFERINHEIKSLLRKRHVPLGILSAIEEDVVTFFASEPLAVYKSCLPSGYQRLLLHACCQYLDLSCQSFNKDGFRWSKVRNNNDYFDRPPVMLSGYLEQKMNF